MANKYLAWISGKYKVIEALVSSVGAGDAGKIVALDTNGKLNNSVLPVGAGTETDAIVCSENLSGGDWVNIYNNAGTINCRKADGSTTGKEANGFVLDAYISGSTATVFRPSQTNTSVTGKTVGAEQWLSVTVPGSSQESVPTTAGQIAQSLGKAKSATEVQFVYNAPIEL